MPAMVLLPLITHILVRRGPPRVGSDTLRIAARAAGGRLRLEIAHSGRRVGSERSDDLHDVEQRLHALYNDEWTLAVEPSGDRGTQVILEFPHEATDGSHR
jgi:LytS/YehU family sensor histidine kinase